jgi:hypothetical protein
MDVATTITTPQSSPPISQRKRTNSFIPATNESLACSTGPTTTAAIRRSQTIYSPLVSSMVQSNTLRDCHQIHSMFLQCQRDSATNKNAGSEPFVCRTAKKYHAMCLSGELL